MRCGTIYIKGSAGYRTGIHMKEYKQTRPVIVVGGVVGSFLGEYMAGGLIIVLGIGVDTIPVGNFTGIGMHGGQIFIRAKAKPARLPEQVVLTTATPHDKLDIDAPVRAFAELFGMDAHELLDSEYFVLRPNATNPYHTLYTANLR
jgi:glutamate synthase domain-containing protein 3